MTRWRSLRAPWAAASAAATGDPPRHTVVAPGPQQEEAAAASTAATGEPPHDTAVATEP
jgi:hypothetical protein